MSTGKSWRELDVLRVHPAAELFPLLNKEDLRALADDIKAHGLQKPISVIRDKDGSAVVLDGRNRLKALELLGEADIWVCGGAMYDRVPDDTDPYAYVISANIHRRDLNGEQKRELIGKLLKASPEKSDRQIATVIKADHKTIGTIRTELEGRGEIPHVDERTDTKGRKQPASKPHKVDLPPEADIDEAPETILATAEDPENYRTAYLLRADQAIRFAVYSGPNREVVVTARRVAAAWNKLAQTLDERPEPQMPSAEDDGLDIPESLRRTPVAP
jgi:hypothetical protein